MQQDLNITKSRGIVRAVEFDVQDIIVVADPCYIDTNDGADRVAILEHIEATDLSVALEAFPGNWVAEVTTHDETGGWGQRVAKLRAHHRTAGPLVTPDELVAENDVDSGQMYVGDAGNLPLDYDDLLAAYDGDFGRLILANAGGAVSSTGYGDGSYPVRVAKDCGRVVCVEVDFLLSDEGHHLLGRMD